LANADTTPTLMAAQLTGCICRLFLPASVGQFFILCDGLYIANSELL